MRDTIELLKDIVSDMDDKIESGDHSQEEIVEMVTKGLEAEGYAPDDITTTMLTDLDAWVMEQVTGAPSSSTGSPCYRTGELN